MALSKTKILAIEQLALAPIPSNSRHEKLSPLSAPSMCNRWWKWAQTMALRSENGVHASRSISAMRESYIEIWGAHPRSEGLTQPKETGPGISLCTPNGFYSWGGYTRINKDLNCMLCIVKDKKGWECTNADLQFWETSDSGQHARKDTHVSLVHVYAYKYIYIYIYICGGLVFCLLFGILQSKNSMF